MSGIVMKIKMEMKMNVVRCEGVGRFTGLPLSDIVMILCKDDVNQTCSVGLCMPVFLGSAVALRSQARIISTEFGQSVGSPEIKYSKVPNSGHPIWNKT